MTAAQCLAVDNLRLHSRQFQRTFGGPPHDVEKNPISVARCGAPRARFEGTAARAINSIAILLQPGAHFREPSNLPRIDSPIWHRSDIEKKVAVAACRL